MAIINNIFTVSNPVGRVRQVTKETPPHPLNAFYSRICRGQDDMRDTFNGMRVAVMATLHTPTHNSINIYLHHSYGDEWVWRGEINQ